MDNVVLRSSVERKYRSLCRTYFILFIITLVLLLTICFVIAFSSSDFKFLLNRRSSLNICTTKACIKAAHTILENIDTSVDPCEDFHAFSCGSFIKKKRIPDDQTKLDVFDILRNSLAFDVADILSSDIDENDIEATKNAKKLFRSCIDEDFLLKHGEERFLTLVKNEFDGWPVIGIPSKSTSILNKLVKLRKLSFKPLIDFHITLNPKDPQYLILKIKQPSWFFNKQYYNDSNFVHAYKEYIYKYVHNLNSSAIDLKAKIEKMFELEKMLSSNLSNEENKRGNTTFKNMTLANLIAEIPQFDWKSFIIDGIFKDIKNVTINESEPIIVDDMSYLKFVTKLIKDYEEHHKRDELENLIIWSVVKNEVTFLPKKYKDIKLDFDKIYRGTKSVLSRQITCSTYTIDVMEFAVGRLYVSKHFNNHSKQAATEMIENIRKEFVQILKESDWLDEESRSLALAKADYIDSKVGYPDFLYNDTYLNELYEKYVMNESEYLHNSFKVLKLETFTSFNELRIKRDRKAWISGPAIVNAFYSPFANQICFPAGILQNPFYDADNPNYLNYGGIGSVIGHEITHGFDDRGRLHDKNGVYYADGTHSLWTNKTINNYKEKAKCIINQYGNYYVKQINKTLNGILTQGENIADNGGIKESFRAYQKWVKTNRIEEPLLPGLSYNQNQLFYINYAQVWCTKYRTQSLLHRILNSNHSPGEFRINGPTSNSEDFARVFNCKLGQKNNPVRKCSVW